MTGVRHLLWIGLLLLLAVEARGAQVQQLSLGASASEDTCAVAEVGTSFPGTTRQVFLRLLAVNVRAGDGLTVEWVDPSGSVHMAIPYEQLPAARSLCLLSQLPVGGFEPGNRPGVWRVRVTAGGGQVLGQQLAFTITGAGTASGIVISKVTPSGDSLVIEGSGFNTESIVHVAQYTSATGWTYIVSSFPDTLAPQRVTAKLGRELKPAEYVVFVKNGEKLSAPSRFVIETRGGYRLPFPPHEQWVISQPPNGGYSHWGRTQHAFDLAPRAGSCIVAMRGGIVHTKDMGYGQTPHLRIFGNYITIDHEDGEYSHYAHLRTGTFRVRTGERVEQGQALAVVGNSGYSFGTHVHVQVTRSRTIATQSIPFRFEDLPAKQQTRYRGLVQSGNRSALGSCSGPRPAGSTTPVLVLTSNSKQQQQPQSPPTWSGEVPVAGWWSQFTKVPAGSKALEVRLGWDVTDRDLDLHLVSPSGRHYGSYGDRTGYSASVEAPEEVFQIPNPEPGTWRVSVQGMRGNGESMPFRVYRR
jgi:murein DD-endopeptidase MepM/ murein hydrolase activator NlpD